MARGSQTAQNAANAGLGLEAQGASTLMPELQNETINPQGFSPIDQAKMTTAAEQSAGGSQAAATGKGALLAGRTKNPGAGAAAIGESARAAGENLSNETLKGQLANANLKAKQEEQGQQGLEGLTLGGLNAVAPNVNANTGAVNASYDWAKDIMDPILSAAGGAAAPMANIFAPTTPVPPGEGGDSWAE